MKLFSSIVLSTLLCIVGGALHARVAVTFWNSDDSPVDVRIFGAKAQPQYGLGDEVSEHFNIQNARKAVSDMSMVREFWIRRSHNAADGYWKKVVLDSRIGNKIISQSPASNSFLTISGSLDGGMYYAPTSQYGSSQPGQDFFY